MKWISICIPFFYFKRTRLNNLRALVFHSLYEWVPALLIVLHYSQPELKSLISIALSYVAFIAMYEIGYMNNDQVAHFRSDERARENLFSTIAFVIFILIRVLVFLAITWYLNQQINFLWWFWYSILIITFATHNGLKNILLKSVTFSLLAFIRFLSPFFILIDNQLLLIVALPVFLNYVLFRLITYMDSKNMLINIDRKSDSFRMGYYVLLLPITGILVLITESYIPMWMNAYFILVNLLFVVAGKLNNKSFADVS
jgi:hypothetical protein